jgi:hypothetical protein
LHQDGGSDEKETLDFKELLISEMAQSEALINILERKGIITKKELLEEIKRVHGGLLRAET